jgi:glycosyltransferase involved in cell wall biosynthesis
MSRPVVLMLLGAYWPGHESTGPNTSARAMCEALCDTFDFRIVARDRAMGTDVQLAKPGSWHDKGFAHVRYLEVGTVAAKGLGALVRETQHDLMLLNGFFDKEFTIPAMALRRLGRIPAQPTLLFPRGEFSQGALSLGAGHKGLYRKLADTAKLMRGIHLLATSEGEAADCARVFPSVPMSMVPEFRPIFALPERAPQSPDQPVRIAFLGRVSPVKGLDFALEALADLNQPVVFDIYGSLLDEGYWAKCQALMQAAPPHVAVTYRGEIANADVATTLAQYDAMLLPSLSENYGHAIFESLAAGTPVMIGDQTPWRNLAEQRAGWDLPVGDKAAFVVALGQLAAMTGAEKLVWREGARAFAERYVQASTAAAQLRTLFHSMINGRGE